MRTSITLIFWALLSTGLTLGCDGDPGPATDEEERRLLDSGSDDLGPGADVESNQVADLIYVEDADRRGPVLNSLIPSRGPLVGGTVIRLVGSDFLPGLVVQIGEDSCLGITVVSESHVQCTVPPGFSPGAVDVTARWPAGGRPAHLADGFTYFDPVVVFGISPDRSPSRGGIEVTVTGGGFLDPTEVRIGGTVARSEFIDDQTLLAIVPAGVAGSVDVVVRNTSGSVTLSGGFTYFEDLVVSGLSPVWGTIDGGTEVALVGAGLTLESRVTFGGALAETIASDLDRTRLRVLSPRFEAGIVDVQVQNGNGTFIGPAAFLYVDPAVVEFGVLGVVPRRVSAEGGDTIVVGGSGFDPATTVEIEGAALACTLLNPAVIECRTGAHATGFVDVTVVSGPNRAELPRALEYYDRVEVRILRPDRGAMAGGTLVEVVGVGFTPDMLLTLDGEPFDLFEFVDAQHIFAFTPQGRPGLASLTASTPADQTALPEAYEYFDPTSWFGGVWGLPIDGALNVVVLDAYSGDPIPLATIMAVPVSLPMPGNEPEILTGLTDEFGQVVLSSKTLSPPQNVTAAAAEHEVTTVEGVMTENVTIYMVPFDPPSGGGGDPRAETPNSAIAGNLTGLAALEKPLDPDLMLAAFVTTTHSSQTNRRANPWPGEGGLLLEDGPFDIISRPGELAVIATGGIIRRADYEDFRDGRIGFWDLHETVVPLAMGFQRFISISPGVRVEGLEVVLDRPMEVVSPVTLVGPSGGVPGAPDQFEAWPFLDFGAEGYWEIDDRALGDTPALLLRHLPDIRDWDADISYDWIALAHANSDTWYSDPYTVTTERTRDVTEGVNIGPFVPVALPVSPLSMGTLDLDNVIEWSLAPGFADEPMPPHATVLSIESEQGLPLWTYITPPGTTSVRLPVLPDEVLPAGLTAEGRMVLTIVPLGLDGGLNYEDFTYEDLGFRRRTTYSFTQVLFTLR
ncbi:MAG: hypothetical protein EXR76_19540 [Myxococcales bacterium]|nr:hypothetical protein [Myxococcales bacterium]